MWDVTNEERKKFLPYIRQGIENLKKELVDDVNLDGLNPSKATELMRELGYEKTNFDMNGWEMDFWITFSKPGEKDVIVSGCGYTFDILMYLGECE